MFSDNRGARAEVGAMRGGRLVDWVQEVVWSAGVESACEEARNRVSF